MTTTMHRPLCAIAREIARDWPAARSSQHPAGHYLAAMAELWSIDQRYGADDARYVIRYFLSNAGGWRGDTARRVKAELKRML
ncbi:hypothetical protein [Rhodococcus sp. 11-3]|uniref:hypothetical protein n=1 Tax=Rhodococcus sp. 11-3 TaxID=2854796 RepID=UPI00203D7F48|nr:hypothetical protein [Rhodococcus sp. 11-3]USC17063.1 hypothetical protein KZJ41_09425 [Rhodococcus sp. 11-3]